MTIMYIVTITVADNGDGKLTPTMTINNKKGQAIEGENIKFTNTYTTGKLTVKNTILGTSSDRETKFTFTIKLSDQTINETFGEIKFVNGEATVELANGESAVMPNLPTGITYKVTQKDANKNGYGTTSEGTEGTITKENESIASFENTRYISLKLTGGTSGFWTIYKIVIIINIILGMIILRRFKYHKK